MTEQSSLRPLNDIFNRLNRQFIGSDKFFNLNFENTGYPPYNIEKITEDQYKLTLALAGWSKDELEVEVENGDLKISGTKPDTKDERFFLYQGIAERNFERHYKLMDNTFVTSSEFKEGMLSINFKREIPETLKPRKISID